MTVTSDRVTAKILVAGVGNIWLSDDGFGPVVAQRLIDEHLLPESVRVVDYGIRGLHLALDLLDGCDALVLIDGIPKDGGSAGEIVLLGVDPTSLPNQPMEAHGMEPVTVLSNLVRLGGDVPNTYVVGCRLDQVGDGLGLSDPVAAAVPEAIRVVGTVVQRLIETGA